MNIYFVNRYSKYKGPFDVVGPNREHIIRVGDICLHDHTDGVAFLVVCSSENSWGACKKVGIGSKDELPELENTLLFSFDGIHGRKGNVELIKQLSVCYREKVIVDFFANAIDILEHKRDFWDGSLFQKFFAVSQELIIRTGTEEEIPTKEKDVNLIDERTSTKEVEDIPIFTDDVQSYILNDFNNKEFKKLLYQYRKGDKRALDKIVKGNLKLVAIIANSYREHGIEHEDLVQEGSIALVRAIERFNPKLNILFPVYAKWLIYQAVSQAVIKMQSLVKIPARQREIFYKVRKSVERYEQEHGYEPSATEIEIEEDIDPREIAFFAGLPDSLHKLTVSCNEWDNLPSNSSADDLLMKESQTYFIDRLLGKIKVKEAYVVRHLYGIGEKSESLSDIGERLGLTRERVRQISEKAIKRLRELIRFQMEPESEDVSPSHEEDRTNTGNVPELKETRRVPVEKPTLQLPHCHIVHQSEQQEVVKNDHPKKESKTGSPTSDVIASRISVQKGKTENSPIRESASVVEELIAGDHIYYNDIYCTVRAIINNGKYSKLIVEYQNGERDTVSYNKSKYVKVSSEVSNPPHNRMVCGNPQLFTDSTTLRELVGLHIITRKHLKHCHKRNLNTIGDVKGIIEKYHLTPGSTRFTKYTIDLWFTIASLSNAEDPVEKEKSSSTVDKGIKVEITNDTIGHLPDYIPSLAPDTVIEVSNSISAVPSAVPYAEIEVPLKDNKQIESEEGRKPIETKTLEKVFDKKATSYKYFWLMAIVSLAKEHGQLSISFKDLTIRMAAMAWPVVFENGIDLGKNDMMKKYLEEVVKKTSLIRAASSRVVETYLLQHYSSQGVDKILAPLIKNVPYRFLSPWIKYTTDGDVVEKSCSQNFNGLYALHSNYIILNDEWWKYIDNHFHETSDFAMQSFIAYAKKYNSDLKLLKLMTTGWQLIRN